MNGDLWREDDEHNVRHYSDLIAQYGVGANALNWGSRESQQLRFSVLAQVGQLDGASVLDVGCGQGDFWGWLKEGDLAVRYTGLDITPRMIEIARRRFPEAHFEVGNLLHEHKKIGSHDLILASGIFTYRKVAAFNFLKTMVAKMFSLSKRAIAFNSLSSWAPTKESGEFYADPLETVRFCRTLTPWVVMRHDYMLHDFTIYMYGEQNSI